MSLVSFFLQVFHQMGQTYVPLYALTHMSLSLSTIGMLRGSRTGVFLGFGAPRKDARYLFPACSRAPMAT